MCCMSVCVCQLDNWTRQALYKHSPSWMLVSKQTDKFNNLGDKIENLDHPESARNSVYVLVFFQYK